MNYLTDEQLRRLKELAEKATPGPRKRGVHAPYAVWAEGQERHLIAAGPLAAATEDDVEFIAACDPATIEALLAELSALRAQAAWVPVAERLPDKSGYYEVTADLKPHIDPERKNRRGVFITSFTNGKLTMDFHDVTAWRPLPEPYQSSKEQIER